MKRQNNIKKPDYFKDSVENRLLDYLKKKYYKKEKIDG